MRWSWWWRRPATSFAAICSLWTLILLRQHALVQEIDTNMAASPPSSADGSASKVHQLAHLDRNVEGVEGIEGSFSDRSITDSSNHPISPGVKQRAAIASESTNKIMKRDAGASVEKGSTSTNRQQPSGDAVTVPETFNGVPIAYRKGAPSSAVHCVGGDSRPTSESWMFRSCQFQHLCMDMETRDYVLVRDAKAKHDDWLPPVPETDNDSNTLTDYDNEYGLSLGGINPRWSIGKGFNKGVWKVRWFPKIIDASEVQVQGYYELPVEYVLVPFHSFAAHNVGHLLWDDFYPIFSLLRLFGLVPGGDLSKSMPKSSSSKSSSSSTRLMLVRQRLGPNRTLYASCDIRGNKRKKCAANFAKFLPLMGVDPASFSTSKDIRLQGQPTAQGQAQTPSLKSRYICARTAAAGLGMLTDHGLRDHGWIEHNGTELEWVPHNLGRGAGFSQFRDFMIRNQRQQQQQQQQQAVQAAIPRVSFSILSSRDFDRRLNFTRQIDYLQESLPDSVARIEALTLWESTMEEQIQIAAQSNIFVTTCGGASMTATFLPTGATLILFYNPTGGFDFFELEQTGEASRNGRAARLDWDLMNHVSHLRVHWLPITSMDSAEDLELLLRLVQHELAIIHSLAVDKSNERRR
jgi:hypothetical protein